MQPKTTDSDKATPAKAEKFVFATVKGFNAAGELEAVASTDALDRQSEIIEPEAFRRSLDTYRTNPVILATHLHRLSTGDSPVIGSAVAIDVAAGALVFRMAFASTDLGKQYETLYREKHMRAFSVGFYPINGEWREMNRAEGAKRIWVHTEVDLMEISAVPVPANPEALARMRAAAAGLDDAGLTKLADLVAARMISPAAPESGAKDDGTVKAIAAAIARLEETAELVVRAVERMDDIADLLPDELSDGASRDSAPPANDRPGGAAAGSGGGTNDAMKSAAEALSQAAQQGA